jgi:hypothetical protein
VEEQTVCVLIQIVEENETLEPTLDSRKSDGADGAIVVAASRWPGLVFLILLLGHLLLSRLLLGCLLLDCLLLGRLLPHEKDKPCHQGFAVPKILTNLLVQLFNSRF